MSDIDYDKLFRGVQQYKLYTQSNFPFKQTNYKGDINPINDGHPGAVGDTYSRIINDKLTEQFIKVGLGNKDWEGFSGRVSIPAREVVEITANTGTINLGNYLITLNSDKTGTDYIWYGDATNADLFATPHDGQIIYLFFPTESTYPKTINATNGITFYGAKGESSVYVPEGGHVFSFEFSESLNQWIVQRAGDFIGITTIDTVDVYLVSFDSTNQTIRTYDTNLSLINEETTPDVDSGVGLGRHNGIDYIVFLRNGNIVVESVYPVMGALSIDESFDPLTTGTVSIRKVVFSPSGKYIHVFTSGVILYIDIESGILDTSPVEVGSERVLTYIENSGVYDEISYYTSNGGADSTVVRKSNEGSGTVQHTYSSLDMSGDLWTGGDVYLGCGYLSNRVIRLSDELSESDELYLSGSTSGVNTFVGGLYPSTTLDTFSNEVSPDGIRLLQRNGNDLYFLSFAYGEASRSLVGQLTDTPSTYRFSNDSVKCFIATNNGIVQFNTETDSFEGDTLPVTLSSNLQACHVEINRNLIVP